MPYDFSLLNYFPFSKKKGSKYHSDTYGMSKVKFNCPEIIENKSDYWDDLSFSLEISSKYHYRKTDLKNTISYHVSH